MKKPLILLLLLISHFSFLISSLSAQTDSAYWNARFLQLLRWTYVDSSLATIYLPYELGVRSYESGVDDTNSQLKTQNSQLKTQNYLPLHWYGYSFLPSDQWPVVFHVAIGDGPEQTLTLAALQQLAQWGAFLTNDDHRRLRLATIRQRDETLRQDSLLRQQLDSLDAIARALRIEADSIQASLTADSLETVSRQRAEEMPDPAFRFEEALRGSELAFICECKKASPSKGLIAPDFPYLEIARDYERAGAECISVLTEPKWFLGDDNYLRQIAETVSVPCIRKDFTVDEYMIYGARALGASAVLLICAILDDGQLRAYLQLSDELGLTALVEAHDENEVEAALKAGARVVGVNNRNLKDFSVDTDNSRRLRKLIPREVLYVSESGVRTAEDIRKIRSIGADAVLVGEALMRAEDKTEKLRELRGIL